MSLEVKNDDSGKYTVAILYRDHPIARHQGGEFSAIFQNSERSLEDRAEDWRAASWTGDRSRIILTGEIHLTRLRTTVYVEVTYQVLSSHLVKKTIRLHQSDMFTLFYQLTNRLAPETEPAKLWSFDHPDCKSGMLHEYFPAAGFRTKDGVTFGLLTDAGYRNLWTRLIRRDGTPVKPAPARIPDLNLYLLSRSEGRSPGPSTFVQQTFGEAAVRLSDERSRIPIRLPEPSLWKRHGGIHIQQEDKRVKLSPADPGACVLVLFPAKGAEVYAVHLKYRCSAPVSVHVWDVDNESRKLGDFSLYNDTVPPSPFVFTELDQSFVITNLEGANAALVLSLADPSETDAQQLGHPVPCRGGRSRTSPNPDTE